MSAPTFELRPYQRSAVEAIERELQVHRGTLAVMPTGSGKTVVFAEVARQFVDRGRVLILAHRTELLEQAKAKLLESGLDAGIEQGERRAQSYHRVVVASVQTLKGTRLASLAPDAFSLVVIDEAHHTPAASYRAVLARFPSAKVLGVTATADRLDGRALGTDFQSVAFRYEIREAIRDGWLSPIRCRRVHVDGLDLSRVRSHHGDLDQAELAAAAMSEEALHGIVTPLREIAGRRRTLVFAVDVAHAHGLAEVLNRHEPGCALAIDGTAKSADRAAALALFRRGTIRYLVNCQLYTEGFDDPGVECAAVARPTQSRALYAQMIGRALRLHPGKDHALVLDFVGVTRHRLAGPADVLAGHDLEPEVLEAIANKLDGQQSLETILAHAEAEAAAKRRDAGAIALVHYRAHEVDPFLGDRPSIDAPWAKEPATERQLAAIETAGLSKPPPGLTRGEASAMLDALADRRARGLASVPMQRLLAKYKLDTRGMTSDRAKQLIVRLRSRGWKPWALQHEPEYQRSGQRRA